MYFRHKRIFDLNQPKCIDIIVWCDGDVTTDGLQQRHQMHMTFDSRSFDACPELCNGTQPTSSYLYTHTKNTNTVPYVCVCICVSAYIVLFESLRKSHKTPEHRVRKSDGVRERDSTNIDYYSVLFRKLIDPNQYRIVLVKLC